jgi:predicted lipid-binding transport protein (Tim44 family)
MMKKMLLLVMAFTVFLAVSAPEYSDAARRGGFKAPRKSYTQTPSKPADNVKRSDNAVKAPGAAAGTSGKRGFFSGGSLMRGLMIGGLAGLLFGGLFAGMGFLGNFLGLLINVLAIYLLFRAIRSVIRYFRQRNRHPNEDRRY